MTILWTSGYLLDLHEGDLISHVETSRLRRKEIGWTCAHPI